MGKRKGGITLEKRLFVGLIMMAFFLLVGTGIYKVKHDPAVLSYLKQVRDYLGIYISLPKVSGGSGLKNTEINYSKDIEVIAANESASTRSDTLGFRCCADSQ